MWIETVDSNVHVNLSQVRKLYLLPQGQGDAATTFLVADVGDPKQDSVVYQPTAGTPALRLAQSQSVRAEIFRRMRMGGADITQDAMSKIPTTQA